MVLECPSPDACVNTGALTRAVSSGRPCRTPLHCAASCNSVHLCKMLVESGAAILATTISDVETAADKCEEMEEGYAQCSQFLYGGFLVHVWLGQPTAARLRP